MMIALCAQRFTGLARLLGWIIVTCAVASSAWSTDLQITNVSLDRRVITVPQESVSITFRINQKATVDLKIFDARNNLVWLQQMKQLPAGQHAVVWNGTDHNGAQVSPEAYFYTVEATTPSGERVSYDLTDVTGGESAKLDGIIYDPVTQRLKFTALHTGRYFLRAGVSQAFVVNTLINNKVIEEGAHEIAWDGYDISHVFNVGTHPKLLLGGFGYRLSDNLIAVKKAGSSDADLTQPVSWSEVPADMPRRQRIKNAREGVDPNYYRNVDQCKDVALRLVLPASLKKTPEGLAIISGPTPVRLELADGDAEVMESQRGEIVFFWDNQLIYDNEVSYYPYTFNWNPPVLDGQPHLLTGFVAGFAGNLALATVKVQLGESPTTAGSKQ